MVAKMASIMGSVNHAAVHTSLVRVESRKYELSLIGLVGIKDVCRIDICRSIKNKQTETGCWVIEMVLKKHAS